MKREEGRADLEKRWTKAKAKPRPREGGGGRRGGRKSRFREHLDDDEVAKGLKSGTLLKGRIRINPRRRIEAYVTIEGLEVDVILKGISAQNRAVEGDLVALELLPPESWDSLETGSEEEETKAIEVEVEIEADAAADDDGDKDIDDGDDGDDDDDEEEEGPADDGAAIETLATFVERKLQVVEGAAGTGTGGRGRGAAWTHDEINEHYREFKRRPSGEVAAIIQPSHQREHIVCNILLDAKAQDEGETTLEKIVMRPIDEKFPLLLLDKFPSKKALHRDSRKLCEALGEAKTNFVLVRMTRWSHFHLRPYCEVVEILGEMSNKESQMAAILLQQGIQQTHCEDFTQEVIDCLPETPWTVSEDEVARRRDLRKWRIFSIDPETARDLDDALSIEVTEGGSRARIGVHIADVTHFVRSGTALDEEAAKRATSVYMVDGVLPMLPRLLCEELCSLNPGTDRLAFSIIWEICLETCEIRDQWIGKSVINSCAKLHYGQAQEIIKGLPLSSEPKIHSHGIEAIAEDVRLLDKVAKRLRKARFDAGALTLNIPRVSIVLDENMAPIGAKPYVQRDSNYLVEEFMLLANRKVAEFLSEKIPSAALLRRHPPPHRRKIEGLTKMTEKMGVRIDTHASGAIHDSLERIRTQFDESTFFAVVLLTTKPMQNAMYFCTGAPEYESKCQAWRHYALAFAHYTHFTSPIRRYADVVVHRLLVDVLDREAKRIEKGTKKGETFESTGTKRSPWGRKFAEKLIEQCEQCNKQKLAAKSVQDSSIKLYLALWLQKQDYETDAVILDLNGPKWMGVFVPEFGMEFKVYWGDDKRLKTKWDSGNKEMVVCLAESGNQGKGEGGEGKKKKKKKGGGGVVQTLRNFQSLRVALFSTFNEKTCTNDIDARLSLNHHDQV